jgi:hypothetical protein
MIRAFIAGAVLMSLAGCASSPPESAARDTAATPVNGASSVAASDSDASADALHVVDVPEVPKVAAAAAQQSAPAEEELICRREKTTGSHRTTRICWKRSEIEKRREEDQQMIRSIQSTPQGTSVR